MIPSWQPLWLRCEACEHEWDDWQPLGVRCEVWVTYVRLLTCPNCGVGPKALYIRTKPLSVPA